MTIHCFERRSLLRRIVGGHSFRDAAASRPDLYRSAAAAPKTKTFLASNSLAGPPQHDDLAKVN